MKEPGQHAIADRIAARFTRPWYRGYARGKLRSDPAYAAIGALLGDGEADVLDIGCGIGLLGLYLRECGFRRRYLGIDIDSRKIAEAHRVASGDDDGLAFVEGGAHDLPDFSGHVVLLDVLHYLDADAQRRLLRDAVTRTAQGARLVVRTVLRDDSWRFRLTVAEERFIHAVRWMRRPARHFPTRDEIETTLRPAGFSVDVRPLWGRTPFNSYLIVAGRRG